MTINTYNSLNSYKNGVIPRTDLCKLNFDLSSIIGKPYYCAAQNSTSLGFGFSKRSSNSLSKRQAQGSTTSYQPAQNGIVFAKAIAVAAAIYDSLHNSDSNHAYLSWQMELSITSMGSKYITKFV
ncbi:uncharacterized protein BJX67DRAFT_382154 [Aspergillus lucknowensis]|uniref:Uncharacterized protein n=1 Tax=Aspergillus lucknowensis TaxID=176173 RepID=A0ABR4LRN7_9EURO